MASPLFFLFFLLSSIPGGAPDLVSDRAALLAFRSSVGRAVLPWNDSTTPCSWLGVACVAGRVAVLRLPAVGLMGQIPVGTVGNLTALRTLSLRYNALSGGLPADLAKCSQLRNLYLQGNRFSGEIPAFLFSLQNLVRLNLAGNDFSGGVTQEFNNLTRLGTLYLESNRLSGEIPELNLPNLAWFNVSFNQLNGSIPSKLRKMPAEAFMKTGLCGGPLGPCPGEIPPSPSPSPAAEGPAGVEGEAKHDKKKLSGGAIAGIAIGAAAGVLIILILVVLLCWKRSSSAGKTRSLEAVPVGAKPPEVAAAGGDGGAGEGGNGNGASSYTAAASAKGEAAGKKLVFFGSGERPFDLEDLLRASAEVLGKGTSGTAYKAVLEMGTTVAVKRLKDVNLAEKEFRERIEAVGAMNHPNLVPLRAYYYSKDEKLLVYDYMPMGSLSALLHGNRGSGRTPLNWDTRSSIALAAARGIEYIHSTGPSASHANIKSSNILLTKSYEARVSDHGLALLVGPASAPTRVAGYRAPEVTDAQKVSQKADVYSFGVLLLELLTGKAPAQALLNDEGVDLPRWVQSVVQEEWTSEVFDLELLRYQNVEEEMVQLLQLAIDCAAQYPDRRPTISEVVVRIEEIRNSSIGAADRGQQQDQSMDDGDDQSSRRTNSIEGTKPSGSET
ncbi:probable inactive receptor kinase At1g48480 [Phoenix dactylifera]|uniref:Probable inactive receptor kinase At1g48480 n=1 Tax=Phoenix dactylifera TaxID=42345 RepID=A0A8B7BMA5_PHODC|nr:probable inactive receptor kinase At1g48480 [Phoenix dactylifera]